MALISISLKVVREALVYCDSLSLRAIVCLILDMPTRVSTLAPLIVVGAVFEVTELAAAGLPAGAVW